MMGPARYFNLFCHLHSVQAAVRWLVANCFGKQLTTYNMTKRRNLRRARRPTTSSGLTLSYSGPVRLNTFDGQDSRPIKANLSYSFTVGSDGSGIASNIIRSPGLTSTSDISSYADVYQEFRVLAIELTYMPFFNGTYNSTVEQGAGAVCTVHVPLVSPPGFLNEVVQHATWSPFRTSVPFKKHWKMFGVEEATFSDIANVSTINHEALHIIVTALLQTLTTVAG